MKKFLYTLAYILSSLILVTPVWAQAPDYAMSTSGTTNACASTSGRLSVNLNGPTLGSMVQFEEGQVVNGVFQMTTFYPVPPTQNTFDYTTTQTKSYRGIVRNGNNVSVPTNVITITVSSAVSAGPVRIGPEYTETLKEYCNTASGTIRIGPSTGSITWQKKSGTSSWSDISPAVTTSTFSFSGVTESTNYRVSVRNGNCQVFSNDVSIVIYKVGTLIATNSPVIEGNKANLVLTGNARVTGVHPEYSYDNGSTWKPMEFDNPTTFDAQYTIHRNTKFRFLVDMGGICAAQYTNVVDVTMTPFTNSFPVNINGTNFYKEQRVTEKGIKNINAVETLSENQKLQVTTYLDGAGRPVQQNINKATPSRTDIIVPHTYDSRGLKARQYLPYASSSGSGSFAGSAQTELALFYINGTSDKIVDTGHPFAETVIEKSPLRRTLEVGSLGSAWQPGSGHTQRTSYLNNAANEVRLFNADGTSSGWYAVNELSKKESIDPDQKKTQVFVDKAGKVLLKREQLDEVINGVSTPWLETYYIYNEDETLKYIISPKGVEVLKTTSWAMTSAFKNQYVYEFIYDEQSRLVEKKIPGQVPAYYCYDRLNRLVLMQDGNLRTTNKWIFIKYDRSGRPVMNGIYTNTTELTRSGMQANIVNPLYAVDTDPYYESRSFDTHGYTNQSFPTTSMEPHTVNYYDNYDFNGDGNGDYAYAAQGLTNENLPDPNVRGLTTGSKRIVLGTTTWLYNYMFYDADGRVIQVRSNNHLSSAIDNLKTIVYDFEGKVKIEKKYHNAGAGKVTTVINKFDYDHMGRLVKVYQNNNAAPSDQLVAQYEYNALGQLVDKKLHNTGGTNFLQSIDYRYSIQGWLQSINNSQLDINPSSNDETNDYFGMEFLYEKVEPGLVNASQENYNGNISAVRWKGPGSSSGVQGHRSYRFTYDKNNRLVSSNYKVFGTTTWDKEVDALNENVSYDQNGNINTLTRNSRKHQLTVVNNLPDISYGSETIDNLTYTYNATMGDQLLKVTDASGNVAGFNNGASVANNDYTYDVNGNLLTDQNKGINANIVYNHLGKPTSISFADGRRIEYVYDAVGSKLTMKSYDAGGVLKTTTEYINDFVYENSALSFFASPEGRVVKKGSALEYQYAIADNQGNTRVVFSSTAATPKVFTATFENPASDGQIFRNVPTTSPHWATFVNANNTPGGTKVVRLNQNLKTGPAKSLKVFPGDKVDMEVWTHFQNASGFGTTMPPLTTLITNVAGAFGGVSGGAGEGGAIFNGVNSALGNFGTGGNKGDNAPAAYLNYILFDVNYKVLNMGWQVVPASALNTRRKISIPTVNVKDAGYIFVYLSYEDESNNYVEFDDFKVTHTPTNIIQYNEYYPFGLQTSNSWTREDSKNDFLYNAGSELNATSGWYETFFRTYDPAIGRFTAIDPLATQYASYSGYHYSFNNPVMFNDPMGAEGSYNGETCPSCFTSGDNPTGAKFFGGDNRPGTTGVLDQMYSGTYQPFPSSSGGHFISVTTDIWVSNPSTVNPDAGHREIKKSYIFVPGEEPETQQAGPGDLSWGSATVDPNSFNLIRIGDAFYTNARFSESMWVVRATNIIRMKKSYIKLNFESINLMVRARQDDGSGRWKSTQEAREDLTWAFNIARFLLFEDLKAGRIESDSEAREKFMDYLNGPLVRADLYPYRGVIPKSDVTFKGIFIWPN